MVRYAKEKDWETISLYDRHISSEELRSSIRLRRVIVVEDGEGFAGWLRFNLFWDNTPFMNLLFLLEDRRGRGYGGQLTAFWETEMKLLGYERVLTSTQADERAQRFYRRQGYTDCGALLLPGEPLEILFRKEL